MRRAGTYKFWIQGSVGRRVTISVDGRVVGTPRWQESYGGVYLPLRTEHLAAGAHTLTLLRGGGSFLPSTGNDASGTTTTLGPVVLQPTDAAETMTTIPASRLRSVCRSSRRLDWIEVLRPA